MKYNSHYCAFATAVTPSPSLNQFSIPKGDCFVMESSDDEKDGVFVNYIPKEISHTLASNDFFQGPGPDVPPEVLEDPRFYPYFKDCVGAVDGIHIPVMVGVDEQGPFCNKNGFLSQIVLALCSFDLKFHYVLAGWEGSAADLRVLNSALTRRNKLQVPEVIFLSFYQKSKFTWR
ncbi:hypothetical protein HYC85_030417 [Camellia sinensis]|uniref:DDE Tnp4 domain-containing protein n=1 Tax=Camellia sinensis TaxID=4442 RepID=A0A7J7G4Q4_CAMSI|nr:hypothetical protein HYC85_030417 [Camellia sinensis]